MQPPARVYDVFKVLLKIVGKSNMTDNLIL
jgi:hypothetical protein